MKRNVGVGVDFSAGSENALHWALANLSRDGDNIFLIYVNNDVEYGEGDLWREGGAPLVPLDEIGRDLSLVSKYGIKFSDETLQQLKVGEREKHLHIVLKVYWGDPREKLCSAEEDLELHCLVVGSRGMAKLKRAILGSTSEYVVMNVGCPVTVIKNSQQCLDLGFSCG